MTTVHGVMKCGALVALAIVVGGLLRPGIGAHRTLADDDEGRLCVNVGGTDGCYASIQAAITAASAGDTIRVAPGTYTGNLVIAGKDNLTIKADDAVLTGPGTPGPCDTGSTTVTGVCIVGQVNFATNPPTVVTPILNTVIKGLTVEGFSSNGIFAFGSDGFRLSDSTLEGNGGYGVFAFHSANVTYDDNVSHDNGDAGFYVGESPAANVQITDNSSYDNKAEGILFRDALGGRITDNQLWGNCVGLLLLTDAPTLPGGNVEVSDNTVRQNNRFCPPSGPAPPESGTGIAIAGDGGVLLSDNTVVENAPSDPSALFPGGILLFDSTQFGGTVATNNRIVDNTAHDNAPADLINQSSGAGNVISDNECGTSIPTGLCQAEEDED